MLTFEKLFWNMINNKLRQTFLFLARFVHMIQTNIYILIYYNDILYWYIHNTSKTFWQASTVQSMRPLNQHLLCKWSVWFIIKQACMRTKKSGLHLGTHLQDTTSHISNIYIQKQLHKNDSQMVPELLRKLWKGPFCSHWRHLFTQ